MSEKEKAPISINPEDLVAKSDYEILHYSIDKDGNWNRKMLSNWGAKEIINTQTWIIVEERLNDAKDRILKGEMSPIGFFMVKCIMDTKLCAAFTGLSKHMVKKHLKPTIFRKLGDDILERYARAFEITLEDLKTFEEKLRQEQTNKS